MLLLQSIILDRLKILWEEVHSLIYIKLCSCDHAKATTNLMEGDRAMEFLQGLHDRYGLLRS